MGELTIVERLALKNYAKASYPISDLELSSKVIKKIASNYEYFRSYLNHLITLIEGEKVEEHDPCWCVTEIRHLMTATPGQLMRAAIHWAEASEWAERELTPKEKDTVIMQRKNKAGTE